MASGGEIASKGAYTIPSAFNGIVIAGQGSDKTTLELKNHLTIDANNATLKGIKFTGGKDLIVGASVANDFDLNDVDATGVNVVINGGGSSSVRLTGSKLGSVTVDKANVRVVLNNTTAGTVTVSQKANVELAGTAKVAKVVANAAVDVKGAERIVELEAKADGVVVDKSPESITGDKGVKVGDETRTRAELDAIAAVAKAEGSKLEADFVDASNKVKDLADGALKTGLQNRLKAIVVKVKLTLAPDENRPNVMEIVGNNAVIKMKAVSTENGYGIGANGWLTFDNGKIFNYSNAAGKASDDEPALAYVPVRIKLKKAAVGEKDFTIKSIKYGSVAGTTHEAYIVDGYFYANALAVAKNNAATLKDAAITDWELTPETTVTVKVELGHGDYSNTFVGEFDIIFAHVAGQ